MDRCEYKVADLTKVEKDIDVLNRLGTEAAAPARRQAPGWEAVGMVSTWGAGGFKFVHPIALLKRRLTNR